jgi:hypothetical protein
MNSVYCTPFSSGQVPSTTTMDWRMSAAAKPRVWPPVRSARVYGFARCVPAEPEAAAHSQSDVAYSRRCCTVALKRDLLDDNNPACLALASGASLRCDGSTAPARVRNTQQTLARARKNSDRASKTAILGVSLVAESRNALQTAARPTKHMM